jgi:hypothetical protein
VNPNGIISFGMEADLMASGFVQLHDNSRARTVALLEHFGWELFDQSLCSPDLAHWNYHLLTYPRNLLRLNSNKKSMESAKTWLSSQAADFYDTNIKKLISPHMINASVAAMNTLRSSLSLYLIFT